MKTKYPKSMEEVKTFCKELCKQHKIKIYFDDKFKNFCHDYHRCVCTNEHIECSKFYDYNYDILLIAVLHELGHILGSTEKTNKKNVFSREYEAWNWAIEKHIELFNRNISVKQARYIMYCLNSYLPDYNSWELDMTNKDVLTERETYFWCPLTKKKY